MNTVINDFMKPHWSDSESGKRRWLRVVMKNLSLSQTVTKMEGE